MVYYQKVEIEEHMLGATEIANLYGILSEKGTPHARLVSAWFSHCEENLLMNDSPKYYYAGKHMLRVYPRCVYVPMMFELAMLMKSGNGKNISFNNNNFIIGMR